MGIHLRYLGNYLSQVLKGKYLSQVLVLLPSPEVEKQGCQEQGGKQDDAASHRCHHVQLDLHLKVQNAKPTKDTEVLIRAVSSFKGCQKCCKMVSRQFVMFSSKKCTALLGS